MDVKDVPHHYTVRRKIISNSAMEDVLHKIYITVHSCTCTI